MNMPTFWQWWFIMGEVYVLEKICTRGFRSDMWNEVVIPMQINARWSPRLIYGLATAAALISIALWPFFLVRSWFK